MSFFTSGLFWFIEGVLACFIVIGLKVWTEDRGVRMVFWKWLLFGVWVLFFGFTIAFVGTSLGENEKNAALYGGIIFSVVSIVSAVGLWRLFGFGKKPDKT